MRRLLRLCLPVLLIIPALGLRAAEERPALLVLVSIDQFRRDYIDRFSPFFGEDGFKRLQKDGADYSNCHFRHAYQITSPGHASLATGVHADTHGIIANDWREGPTLSQVNSVKDDHYRLIGLPGLFAGRSPARLMAPAIADQLKENTAGKARVLSIAIKDRAAVLMGGHKPDAAYWFDQGNFVSSTYYRQALPAWAERFNASQRSLAWKGKVWDHLLEPALYDKLQGPDDSPGEENVLGLGTRLPKKLGSGDEASYLATFPFSPFSSDLLEEFAEQAILAEKLGTHETPDLLCLGFSQIDIAGHLYGPDSHEIMDSVIRLDRTLASLLRFLDKNVGMGRYTLVVTADHGCTPMPERLREKGIAGERFDRPGLDALIAAKLIERYGPAPAGKAYTMRDAYGFRALDGALEAKGIERKAFLAYLKQILESWHQIASAYTRDEILAIPAQPEGDSLIERVRRSYYPERSADVVYIMKPNITDKVPLGCSHGSPYDCDDHVPQLWFGAGVKPGRHEERVGMDTLTPTACKLLGVPPPPAAKAKPLF